MTLSDVYVNYNMNLRLPKISKNLCHLCSTKWIKILIFKEINIYDKFRNAIKHTLLILSTFEREVNHKISTEWNLLGRFLFQTDSMLGHEKIFKIYLYRNVNILSFEWYISKCFKEVDIFIFFGNCSYINVSVWRLKVDFTTSETWKMAQVSL